MIDCDEIKEMQARLQNLANDLGDLFSRAGSDDWKDTYTEEMSVFSAVAETLREEGVSPWEKECPRCGDVMVLTPQRTWDCVRCTLQDARKNSATNADLCPVCNIYGPHSCKERV